MNKYFGVTGLFYELEGYKLRKYLDIQKYDVEQSKPDLMVVMMNPGSSYPLDGIDHNHRSSKAMPDKTQRQIMQVMENTSLNYARVLNLSDLRTPDSNVLFSFLKSSDSKRINHSIFFDSRKSELEKLFTRDVPVIYGWGVNSALVPLAKKTIETLAIKNPLGILKSNSNYSYYHPLPRVYKKQVEWVQHVTNQIIQLRQTSV